MEATVFEQHQEAEVHHWWFAARLDIFSALIRHLTPSDSSMKIVDIGCGTGAFVAKMSDEYDITGLDASPDAIKMACKNYPSASFAVVNDTNEIRPYIKDTDLVSMFDVLEHIEKDHAYLKNIVDALPTGGKILLTVPANMNIWGVQDVAVGHFRRYTLETLSAVWQDLPVTCHWQTYYNARLYPLIYIARAFSRKFGVSVGKGNLDYFVPPKPINAFLKWLFAGELPTILKLANGDKRTGYSHGVSIIAFLTKNSEGAES